MLEGFLLVIAKLEYNQECAIEVGSSYTSIMTVCAISEKEICAGHNDTGDVMEILSQI